MEGALRESSVDRMAVMGVEEEARRGVWLAIVVDDEVDTEHDVLACSAFAFQHHVSMWAAKAAPQCLRVVGACHTSRSNSSPRYILTRLF